MKQRKVAVIGAGIGGLAVARALALRGAEVTLFEQAGELGEIGAGVQISPNGFAVLRALGLGQALQSAAMRAAAVQLVDHRGRDVLRLDLAGMAADQPYYFVHRADLITLLAKGAEAAGAQIRYSRRVESVTDGPRARIECADGSVFEADLVIGADGLHSRLRGLLNGDAAPFFTGHVAWRALVPNRAGRGPEARVHMGPGRHIVSYPLRDAAMINLVAVEERRDWVPEGWQHRDDPKNLRQAFAGFCPEVTEMLAEVKAPGLWGLFRHPVAPHWHGQALALLGDAAHPTLPFMAQGANMALEDAWVLADALAGQGIEEGLQRYQQRRQTRVARVLAAANGNAWKYHLSFAPLRFAAHTALRLGGRLAPGKMLHQFDWLYGHDVTQG